MFTFSSKPLMNLRFISATVHSLMNDTSLIDSCKHHLPLQYASNIEFIRQKFHWGCDRQRATSESHMQNKPLVCSIACSCSKLAFPFYTPTKPLIQLHIKYNTVIYNFYILYIYNKMKI